MSWKGVVLAGGNGYLGQNELTVHFGLDTATVVDEVRVQWPDGKRRTLIGQPGNQTIEVRRRSLRRSTDPLTPVARDL